MKNQKLIAALLLLFFSQSAFAAKNHHCNENAIAQAKSLLQFHAGKDDRMVIESKALVLKPIKNPANPKQMLDVLEVWGNIYKGRYRIHLIYAQTKDDCVLMGQEVLEYARL
jgi:hypothetical protein